MQIDIKNLKYSIEVIKLEFKLITANDQQWQETIEYAKKCNWKAGASLAKKMHINYFDDWQRVLIVKDNDKIIAFCTISKKDSIDNVSYFPFIGYIFVDSNYRGQRLGQKMIEQAIIYLKKLHFKAVYVVTDHENLYEKFDFYLFDLQKNKHGSIERVYKKDI